MTYYYYPSLLENTNTTEINESNCFQKIGNAIYDAAENINKRGENRAMTIDYIVNGVSPDNIKRVAEMVAEDGRRDKLKFGDKLMDRIRDNFWISNNPNNAKETEKILKDFKPEDRDMVHRFQYVLNKNQHQIEAAAENFGVFAAKQAAMNPGFAAGEPIECANVLQNFAMKYGDEAVVTLIAARILANKASNSNKVRLIKAYSKGFVDEFKSDTFVDDYKEEAKSIYGGVLDKGKDALSNAGNSISNGINKLGDGAKNIWKSLFEDEANGDKQTNEIVQNMVNDIRGTGDTSGKKFAAGICRRFCSNMFIYAKDAARAVVNTTRNVKNSTKERIENKINDLAKEYVQDHANEIFDSAVKIGKYVATHQDNIETKEIMKNVNAPIAVYGYYIASNLPNDVKAEIKTKIKDTIKNQIKDKINNVSDSIKSNYEYIKTGVTDKNFGSNVLRSMTGQETKPSYASPKWKPRLPGIDDIIIK